MIGRKVFFHAHITLAVAAALGAGPIVLGHSLFVYLSTFTALLIPRVLVLRFQLHLTSVLHAPRGLSSWRIDCHLPLNGICSQLLERVFYIDIVLCAGLKEYHVAILLTELLAVERADLALLLQIHLVPNDEERESFRVLWLWLCEKHLLPVKQMVERDRIGHVVDQTTAVCAAVKRRG